MNIKKDNLEKKSLDFLHLHQQVAENGHLSYYVTSLLLVIDSVYVDEIPMKKVLDSIYTPLEPLCDLKNKQNRFMRR
jgi:hypothetical protein